MDGLATDRQLQCPARQAGHATTVQQLRPYPDGLICNDGRDETSDAAGLNVTEHVPGAAQEYDAVPGRIRFVPFEFVVGDFDFGSDVDVGPATRLVGPIVSHDRVGFAVPDMDFVSPIGIGFAAA
jgi:hypothetical protein